jgi:GPH family glycoside/pentoside/hexuronide:cation symporter
LTQDRRPGAEALSLRTMVTFSLANLPLSALGVGVAIFLPRYFASHLGVSLTVIGAAFATVRFLDIGVDPLLGLAMDRTRTPVGRYRAWMLLGAPVLMLAADRLFLAPVGIGAGYLIVWLLVMYLGTSILGLSFSAWGATLATAYHERSRLFGMAAPVGVAGSLFVLALPAISKGLGGTDAEAVQAMGWLVLAVTPIAIGLVAWLTPERIAPDTRGPAFTLGDYWALASKPEVIRLFVSQLSLTLGPGWLTALYLFFASDVLGFSIPEASGLVGVSAIGGALGGPVFAQISRRLGKHRTLMLGTTGYSLGLLGFLLVGHANLPVAIVVMAWLGFVEAGFTLMTRAMMADVGDEVRLQQGKERIGLLYSLITLATKIAGAVAIGLTYPLLARIGFKATEGAVNTAQALQGLALAYYVGPIVFVMLGGACFIGWRLDAARHGEIRRQLDVRDAELAETLLAEGTAAYVAISVLAPDPE